jgi:hypothetical protein
LFTAIGVINAEAFGLLVLAFALLSVMANIGNNAIGAAF